MKWEYLLFNLIVISGPLLAIKFYPKIRIPNIRKSLVAVGIPAIFFILWDQVVTGWFWDFNPLYITGIKIFKLPLEEILFFLTVPWACLFLWVNIQGNKTHKYSKKIYLILLFIILLIVSYLICQNNLFYTASVFFVLSLIILVGILIKNSVFLNMRIVWFIIMVLLLTLIFNGYLTARPIVIYNESVKTNFNIFTVPIEDFIYGIALVLWVVMSYEKLVKDKIDA